MAMSKEEVVAAIRECAAELGRCPGAKDLRRFRNVQNRSIRRHFTNMTHALHAAGLDPRGPGYRVNLDTHFVQWAQVVRQLGKIPTMFEYEQNSRFRITSLTRHFGAWSEVPRGLLQHARARRLEAQWPDVLAIVRAHENQHRKREHVAAGRLVPGKPVYGRPLNPAPLIHAPTNEMGVVYLFGALAADLGFMVTRIQNEFPDCEAMRRADNDQWQRLRVEFEYESRNFRAHQHDPDGCDLIVCWVDNWPERPENLEVLELSTLAISTSRLYDWPDRQQPA